MSPRGGLGEQGEGTAFELRGHSRPHPRGLVRPSAHVYSHLEQGGPGLGLEGGVLANSESRR